MQEAYLSIIVSESTMQCAVQCLQAAGGRRACDFANGTAGHALPRAAQEHAVVPVQVVDSGGHGVSHLCTPVSCRNTMDEPSVFATSGWHLQDGHAQRDGTGSKPPVLLCPCYTSMGDAGGAPWHVIAQCLSTCLHAAKCACWQIPGHRDAFLTLTDHSVPLRSAFALVHLPNGFCMLYTHCFALAR